MEMITYTFYSVYRLTKWKLLVISLDNAKENL